MKTILCYGDSNTWGFVAGSIELDTLYCERFPQHQRWTGRLQASLGHEFQVVEAGLNARTTNVDDPLTSAPSRNGVASLLTHLYSHAPLDLVILMLGSNDLKTHLNRTNAAINQGIEMLIQTIQSSIYGKDMRSPPAILLVSPPVPMNEEAFYGMFEGARAKAERFAVDYQRIAKHYDCHFLDAAPHIQHDPVDGLHFSASDHQRFAHVISEEVLKIDALSITPNVNAA